MICVFFKNKSNIENTFFVDLCRASYGVFKAHRLHFSCDSEYLTYILDFCDYMNIYNNSTDQSAYLHNIYREVYLLWLELLLDFKTLKVLLSFYYRPLSLKEYICSRFVCAFASAFL